MMEIQEVTKHFFNKGMTTSFKPTKHLAKLASLGFGLLLVSWLLSQLDWSETVAILRNVPISLLVLGLFCYALSFYLRSLRFRWLLPGDKQRNHLFPIVLVHYTALNIIPARLGELSYIYLLNKVNQMPIEYSLSSLLLARVFDQLAIALLFLLSSGFVAITSPWLQTVRLCVSGFLLGTVVIILLLFVYKDLCLIWLKHLLRRMHWDHIRIVQRIVQKLDEIVTALHHIHLLRQGASLLVISVGIWLSIFSVNYCLLRAFQMPLTYIEIMFTSTCIILLSVLPLQMLGGLGVYETTLVFLAEALGAPRNIVITAAFSSHVLASIYLCLFGIYGFWTLQSLLGKSSGQR